MSNTELEELKKELQIITYADNYRAMMDKITKWRNISQQILILKFIVYHYQIAKSLLKGNYKTKNKIDVALRITLMTQNNQVINDFISLMIGLGTPPKWHYDNFRHLPKKSFGSYKPDMIHEVCATLNQDAYAIFPRLLSEEICDSLLKGFGKLKYHAKYQNQFIEGIQLDKPIGLSHWVDDQKEVFYLPEIQELLQDPIILSICQLYLQTTPILTQTNFWWSARNDTISQKQDYSQMFHQDQDDVKFIKVFIYLNEVTLLNGPHTYAKGSIHNRSKLPKDYKISNRVTDDWIKQTYGQDSITQITGPKGTILFGNTNAFHKGKPMIKGYRYLLQLEFGCSLSWFENNHIDLQKSRLSTEMNEFMDKYPVIFLKYRRL